MEYIYYFLGAIFIAGILFYRFGRTVKRVDGLESYRVFIPGSDPEDRIEVYRSNKRE